MSHLHKETHTIEESAPVAGAAGQRQGGVMGNLANAARAIPVAGKLIPGGAGANIAPAAGLGREFHVHGQQQVATGPYLQEQETFVKQCGGEQTLTTGQQFVTSNVQQVNTIQTSQPVITKEQTTVISHQEKPEFRSVNVGKQLLTHTEQNVVQTHQEAPVVTQNQREIIHEHHKNIMEEQHKDVVHEHHKNILHEHIQPIIHEQVITEKHVPIIHESEKQIIHEKHIPIIHERHDKRIVEETRAPIVHETTQQPIVTHSREQTVVLTEQAQPIITEEYSTSMRDTNLVGNMQRMNLGTTTTSNVINTGSSLSSGERLVSGGQNVIITEGQSYSSGQQVLGGQQLLGSNVSSGLASTHTHMLGEHLHGQQQFSGQQYAGQQVLGSNVTTTQYGASTLLPGTQMTGTGGQFIDQSQQRHGLGGMLHNIKTALIGDKHATNLRQEEIDSTIIPTQQTVQGTTFVQKDQNLMRHI